MHWIHLHFVILLNRLLPSYSLENWPWSGGREPRVEQVIEGQDVVLRCAGRLENTTAFWEYKACGSGLNATSCVAALMDSQFAWTPRPSSGAALRVTAAKPDDAGLYRCRQPATERIDVHSAVELEVLPLLREDDLPHILIGFPKNVTVNRNSQAVFQCKVLSRSPLNILWAAQDTHAGAGALHYLQHWYAPLPPAGELGLPGNVHLSKMVLPRAQPENAGRYFCVAVNNRGFTNSSAYLEVIEGEDEEWNKQSSETWSLYFLFLLPVALALVPISLWLCYSWSKRRSRAPEEELPQEYGFPLHFDVDAERMLAQSQYRQHY